MTPSNNPFLQGNFAPWPAEGQYERLPVRGKIPHDLEGTFFRNGPNPAFPPLGQYHWFDGDGMIHAIRLRGQSASYQNRWVCSRGLEEERRAGQPLYYGLLEVEKSGGRFKNAANTNVVFHAGRLLALYEAALPTELDPRTLATIGEYDFGGRLQGPMTAHPKMDPVSGEMWFFGYQAVPPYLVVHQTSREGVLLESVPVDAEWPASVHDFVITPNYAVIFVFPLLLRIENLGTGRSMFSWEEERGSRIAVIPRQGGNREVRWFSAPSGYVFHFMNAFERDDRIIVDGARYPRMLFLNRPEQGAHDFDRESPSLYRFEIDLGRGEVEQTQVADWFCEFPRIHEGHLGHPYRYGYSVSRTMRPRGTQGPEFDAIVGYDWETGRVQTRSFGAQAGVGEPVFVPRSGAKEEGEGYVLVLVYDRTRDTSDFYVLSAEDLAGDPLAVIELPHRVPYGFHGNWVPAVG